MAPHSKVILRWGRHDGPTAPLVRNADFSLMWIASSLPTFQASRKVNSDFMSTSKFRLVALFWQTVTRTVAIARQCKTRSNKVSTLIDYLASVIISLIPPTSLSARHRTSSATSAN
jgi:hypothetical protein